MKSKKWILLFLIVCMGVLTVPVSVRAGRISSLQQAQRKAQKKVKGAYVTELDEDYDKGIHVYEVQLHKGTKQYDLVYRASDGKLISYGWDQMRRNLTSKKAVISQSVCKKLAKKEVKNSTIKSIRRKWDDGVIVWKVKLTAKDKLYTLEYHARTRALLEYEWEIVNKVNKPNKNTGYIGHDKAKSIALNQVPGAHVIQIEFEIDDGIPVYQVELLKDSFEFDIEINAKTGGIIDYEQSSIFDAARPHGTCH